jgi:hypothetical protein
MQTYQLLKCCEYLCKFYNINLDFHVISEFYWIQMKRLEVNNPTTQCRIPEDRECQVPL